MARITAMRASSDRFAEIARRRTSEQQADARVGMDCNCRISARVKPHCCAY
jgi:hypothetical protein